MHPNTVKLKMLSLGFKVAKIEKSSPFYIDIFERKKKGMRALGDCKPSMNHSLIEQMCIVLLSIFKKKRGDTTEE
jgi:hypothetical protein